MINLVCIIIFILGLFIGSFLNVCICRIPKGESIVFPPSHCSRCKHPLSPIDLVPVISFLLLKGRCRYCREKISVQYPLVELLTGVLFYLIYQQYGLSLTGLAAIILVCTVLLASFIDLKHKIIPNSVTLFITLTGVFFMLIGGTVSFWQSLLGFAIGGGILLLLGVFSLIILNKEGMGGGDIKLAAACGVYLGANRTIITFIITAYIAGFILLILLAAKKIRKDQYVPFGPFLSAAVIIVILLFDKISNFIIRI